MKAAWILAFSAFALALAANGRAQEAELLDRIVAVVDDDPILESDLDRVIGLRLIERNEEEEEGQFRRRVLDQVIEETLRFHEIDRFGFTEISLEDVAVAYDSVRSRFDDEAAFRRYLGDLGLDPEELKQLVARQLMVVTYVDERLGPRVFVTSDEIERYYRENLIPELEARGEPIPALTDVREEIRAVVKEQRLDEEIERWTAELRREADIEDYFDDLSETPSSVAPGSKEPPA